MRKSRFTEEQIVAILKEGEAGVPVADLLRRHGISRATYFLWRSKYAGTTVPELRRIKTSLGAGELGLIVVIRPRRHKDSWRGARCGMDLATRGASQLCLSAHGDGGDRGII